MQLGKSIGLSVPLVVIVLFENNLIPSRSTSGLKRGSPPLHSICWRGISGSEKQLFPTQSLEIGYIDLPSRSIKRALVRA
jgi:hypothetical protein